MESIRVKAQLQIDYADGSSELVVSDELESCLWSDLGIRHAGGETYDAQRNAGWDRAGFDASNWSAVNVGSAPEARSHDSSLSVCRFVRHGSCQHATQRAQPGKFVFDLGQNFSGWIRNARAKQVLKL